MKKINIAEKPVSKRSLSRLIAVQSLYQYYYLKANDDIMNLAIEIVDNYLIDAENDQITSYRKKIDMKLLTELLENITEKIAEIDKIITKSLEKQHNLSKIQDVILAILRIAIFELKFINKTPFKVIIDEYVNIASSFMIKKALILLMQS